MNPALPILPALLLTAILPGQGQPAMDDIWTRSFGLTEVAGALHAAGPGYHARITATGIELWPAGARTGSGTTLALSFESVHRGDVMVHEDSGAAGIRQDGLVARIDRGAGIEERFEARRDGVEHSFAIERRLPGTGDLVVRMRADTDLAAAVDGEGLRFSPPEGCGVSVGAVTGIDADGRQCRGSLRCAAGHLEYRLPSDFVDGASYPLLVDPVLGSTVTVLPASADHAADVDVAYDESNAVYLVVWARATAAGTARIEGQRVSAAGALVGGLITIQPAVAGEVFGNPAVAGINAANKFVVVYERTPSGGATEIHAKTVLAGTGAVSSASTLVSSQGTDGALNPDIGGRGVAGGVTAMVVWETGTTSHIHAQVVAVSLIAVTAQPSLIGTEVTVASQPGFDERVPAVSRHGGDNGTYLVVWEREITGRIFVGGRIVGSTGGATLLTPMTTVTPGTSPPDELTPDCATPDGTNFLVVYEQTSLPGIAAKTATFDPAAGTLTIGAENTLAVATPPVFPPNSGASATEPAVDFADSRYLVVYRAGTVMPAFFPDPARSTSAIRLLEIGLGACVLDPSPSNVDTGQVTTDPILGSSGSSVTSPAVCAVFSGAPAAQVDEGLVPFVRSSISSSGIPPVSSSQRGVTARRVEAVGQGGAVTSLAPSCGGAGTAGVNGPVVAGSTSFAFTLTGGPAGSVPVFFNFNVPGPLSGCGPCQVLPYSIVLFQLASNGSATLPVAIPCAPELINDTFAVQWTVIGPTPCAFQPQLAWSNVMSFTIAW